MNDDIREQIHNNLNSKETEDLLEIWQNGDVDEWDDGFFDIVKVILLKRLGYLPPQSIHTQVSQLLDRADEFLEKGELAKALSKCELAIQMSPNFAIAYNCRGEIYDEMGQLENAIINYQKAIQLDPELKDAWNNMLSVEVEMEEEFQESSTKHHLDQALEYAYNDEPEKTLEECEIAKSAMPSIAVAYNYLGMILETLNQLELAIDSYLKAIELNPRFYAARENLGNARVKLEEELYHLIAIESQNEELREVDETSIEYDESQISEILKKDNPIPGWVYLDEKALLLIGWAGYRNRPGRSGYDPLERNAEQGHMQGVMIWLLITRKFRTRNPIYLFVMTCVGIIYCLPLIGMILLYQENWNLILPLVVYSPFSIIGVALLINVYLSLRLEKSNEYDENGFTFF